METKEPERGSEGKKSITIYLQAHGFIIPGEYIPPNISRGCQILSFTGGIGRSGIMKRGCDDVVIEPPLNLYLPKGMELPGSEELPDDVEFPTIHVDGAQIDIMALSYIQQVYTFMNSIPSIDDNTKSQLSFRVVVKEIPKVYSNCGINRFPRSKIPDEPFSPIPALQDKTYQLHPNAHEDCVSRGQCSRLGCDVLEKSEQVCPYYGVYVVYSTNPDDIDYTLSGRDAQGENHTFANLNTRNGYGAKYYWETKIEEHMDDKIDKASTETERDTLEKEKVEIIGLYNKMTESLEEDMPISEKITMEESLPEINLYEILKIFIIGMGYDEINIIDPSCDTCTYSKPFKLLANKIFRDVRWSRNSKKRKREGTIGGKKMAKKQKSRKSNKIRKHKTYKKRKHIKMSYK